uniref:Uncharacterized protein n=1 Tax=Aegilops tauschii TaxID=37682 RepID=N1R1Q9_AEGTA
MTACVIMHNMIVEDERDESIFDQGFDYQRENIEPLHQDPATFEQFVQFHRAESGATVLELRHHASLGSGGRSSRAEEARAVLASDAARVSSLQRRVGSYGLIRSPDAAAASKLAQVPSLKLAFDGGAEVEVDSKGVLYVVAGDASQVCLALAALRSEDDTPIIGNYQQKNLRVIFDTAASQIGFAQETCDYI